MESFSFIRMKPDHTTIKSHRITPASTGVSRVASTVRALSEPGQAYAIYIQGGARVELVLELPVGGYRAEWIDTKTGQSLQSETFTHDTGSRTVVSPDYSDDIALRLYRVL